MKKGKRATRREEEEDGDGEEEEADAGTGKPAVKGRQMYVSERLQFVEYATSSSHLYFRANCAASMKRGAQDTRFPGVAINLFHGTVDAARATCVAKADGRCVHVAALLYLVEDLSLGQEPKIERPTTSKPQYWGKGSQKELDPTSGAERNYSKKRQQDRYLNFDPRPRDALPPSHEKFLF